MSMWDNQQETSWFVGILEAEGTCGNTHDVSGQQIRVSNMDGKIIEACESFLQKKAITFSSHTRKDKLITLSICGKNNCYTLLKWLGDSLQCRREEFYDKLQLGSSTTTRDATLTPDLHWLVGVFEGEGCLTLDQNRNTFAPRVRFVNTSRLIVQKFVKTLKDNGLSWYIYERPSDSYKDSVEISMTGALRCKRFLVKTSGLWRSEIYAQRAARLLKFIDLRLAVPKGSPYTQEHLQIYRELMI